MTRLIIVAVAIALALLILLFGPIGCADVTAPCPDVDTTHTGGVQNPNADTAVRLECR